MYQDFSLKTVDINITPQHDRVRLLYNYSYFKLYTVVINYSACIQL